MQPLEPFTPLKPNSVLVVMAHPDDIEVCCGGAIAHWTAQGAAVHYLILTDGSVGTSDRAQTPQQIAETRQAEQRAAAETLRVSSVTFGQNTDGTLANTPDVRREIVRAIRTHKPEVVITFDPTMVYSVANATINHPDHRAAGQATLDAVFPQARDHLSFPELLNEGLEPHKTPTILLVHYDMHNFYVDITDTMDAKLRSLAAHASQFNDIELMESHLRDRAEKLGTHIGCKYAEGFVRIDIPS